MPRNGNTTARGYGSTHRRTRADWEPTVTAGLANCWRCRRRIPPPPPGHSCRPGCRAPSCWDLGHDDHDRTITRGPEHRHRVGPCPGNRSTGATRGNRARPARRRPRIAGQRPRPSLALDDW